MPSATLVEINEPSSQHRYENESTSDLLLREIRGSNIRHLHSLHSRGTVLFTEGEPARGVHIVRTGRALASISSSEGRVVILRVVQAGDVLGLNSVLRNSVYDTTVKTIEPCSTDFLWRAELMELMEKSRQGTHAILKTLSREVTEFSDRARLLLLPQTIGAKLAHLLLEWCDESGLAPIERIFTQEEIAQMICTTRETVTRLLASLCRRQVIQITSDSILIRDHAALRTMTLGENQTS